MVIRGNWVALGMMAGVWLISSANALASAHGIRGRTTHATRRMSIPITVASKGRSPAVLIQNTEAPRETSLLSSSEVRIRLRDGSFLSGSFLRPKRPRGAVLLLTGSGVTNRFENVSAEFTADGKPALLFKAVAEQLVHHGIAVLAYDKRGVRARGENFQDNQVQADEFAKTTPEQLLEDALSAYDFLRQQPGIDPRRISIIGHSEGGVLALKVAESRRDVRGLYLLGMMVGSFGDVVRYQMVENPLYLFDLVDQNRNQRLEAQEWRPFQSDDPVQFSETSAMRLATRSSYRGQLENLHSAFLREFGGPAGPRTGAISGDLTPAAWYRGYLAEGRKSGGYRQRLLPFCSRTSVFHGVLDRQTPFSEVQSLHEACTRRGTPLSGVFAYSGLGHGFSPPRGFRQWRDTFGPMDALVERHLVAKVSADF